MVRRMPRRMFLCIETPELCRCRERNKGKETRERKRGSEMEFSLERFTQTTVAAVTINIKSPRSQFCVASTRTAAKRRLIMTFEVFLYTQILLSIVLLSFFHPTQPGSGNRCFICNRTLWQFLLQTGCYS